ncbi:sugar transferase [Halopiger goleimassiliensis]|uniref:sugar transferase n=1 Tax=Halopiger goleimassiliensis TaxID=1293048 RepID=UPI0006777F6C|nr:sugar transferase [Halopiger goleimassiliensis]
MVIGVGREGRSIAKRRTESWSQLAETLRDRDIDTVALAFASPDRRGFFGTLRLCRELGLDALGHRRHADSILVAGDGPGEFVEIDLEPWGPLESLVKRAFDVAVAGTALVVLAPVVVLIALAITIEGEGPVFFTQQRTCRLGRTFELRKFRTLKPKEGGEVGTVIDEDRQTPLGQLLRTTHLDEIPQLWSILVGRMSVVGPRPAQTKLEPEFEASAPQWRRRWFVKPGLTGLAQISGATSQEPAEKLAADLQYVRDRSFWFDVRILLGQFRNVFADLADLVRRS